MDSGNFFLFNYNVRGCCTCLIMGYKPNSILSFSANPSSPFGAFVTHPMQFKFFLEQGNMRLTAKNQPDATTGSAGLVKAE